MRKKLRKKVRKSIIKPIIKPITKPITQTSRAKPDMTRLAGGQTSSKSAQKTAHFSQKRNATAAQNETDT
ncbi:TPA: hypothetical protein ROF25_005325 [Escherichia coli]|uniref:hypothetical protein n=1 Tax=Escherichia coli TaxID=562 RepID=UPI00053B846E|nr:hypothetical protein [Escherichia coli]HDX3846178.1 hypothetical protein [Escherichia coli]